MRDRRLVLSTPVYTYFPHLSNGRLLPALLAGILLLTLLTFSATPTLHARPLTEEDVLPPTHMIADHVVISEVQTSGSIPSDEFVELYNPTGMSISVVGWRLVKRVPSGTNSSDDDELLVFPSDTSIEAYGFLLIAHGDYDGGVSADFSYTTVSIANDNSLLLYKPDGSGGWEVVDILGWGSAKTFDTSAYLQNPTANRSIERKAFYFSSGDEMVEGGSHVYYGNAYDTNDNATDFYRREYQGSSDPRDSNPQSSTSDSEPCCTTVTGTLTRQGRANHSGTEVLLWPGSGLRAATYSSGYFSIPNVPAIASAETPTYTVEVASPGYLSPRTTLDLRNHLDSSGYLTTTVTFPALPLLAGDLNGDNQVNIFDLAIVGSHYGSEGVSAADVNGDGKVNIQDLALISGNFGRDNHYTWSPTP